jgi:diguanylate cyclase (GGDEF)-like protein
LLLPETDNTQAINLAKQCSCSVEKQKIQHERSLVSGILTVSAGISTFTQSDDFSELVLVELADKLLYQAKHNGRNRFEYQIT